MNSVPLIATVADLQRKYRSLVDKIKETGEPLVVVNNGQPDVVVLDTQAYNTQVAKLKKLEEESLLRAIQTALEEHKTGKTVKLGRGQKLTDLLD
nr:MAG: hypothetical protein A2V48_01430 [Candidatus Amesbacteria bacterium RBG_19FT_COMBO_48_16]